MSSLGNARWFLDADTLGLAHILVRARPDVTFPGDDGIRHKSRWTLPPCIVQDQGALDVDWIPAVSAAGLAVITRDNKILSRRRELDTVLVSRAKLFAISGATPLSTWQQLEIVVRQWDAMETARQEDGPFVYLVSRSRISRADVG